MFFESELFKSSDFYVELHVMFNNFSKPHLKMFL